MNCVGDAIRKPTEALPSGEAGMSSEEWHTVIDINLTEAFESCRGFGPHLLERRQGSVINISSFAGLRPAPNVSTYAAAKTGLHRFTESIALEWAPYGVRANVIAPGQFPDPDQMTHERLRDSVERARQAVRLGRTGTLREVGLMAVYLSSDAAAYVTGAIFQIDGGLTLR